MSIPTFENVQLAIDGHAATITLSRPSALNALNAELLADLGAAIGVVESSSAVRGLVITGEGPKAFAAGADISRMPEMSEEEARRFSAEGSALFRRLEQLRVPVIAAVNGFALGGGCELALACDFIYASRSARFGQPEVNLGLIAGFGGTQRLTRRVGVAMAIELLTTGRMIDAEEALRIGLANRVVDAEALLGAARATVDEIATRAPLAVAASKRLAYRALDVPLDEGLAEETAAFAAGFGSADAREGVAAFLGKRKPDFRGC